MALQEKINSYFDFVEGGQIYDDYPAAQAKGIVISLITKYEFPLAGKKLLEQAALVGASLSLTFEYLHYPGKSDLPEFLS